MIDELTETAEEAIERAAAEAAKAATMALLEREAAALAEASPFGKPNGVAEKLTFFCIENIHSIGGK